MQAFFPLRFARERGIDLLPEEDDDAVNIEPNDEGEAGDLSVAANMHDEDEYDGNEITTEMEQQLGLSLARGV